VESNSSPAHLPRSDAQPTLEASSEAAGVSVADPPPQWDAQAQEQGTAAAVQSEDAAVVMAAPPPVAQPHTAAEVIAAVDLALLPFRMGGALPVLPEPKAAPPAGAKETAPARREPSRQSDPKAVAAWLGQQPGYRVLGELVPLPPAPGDESLRGALRVAFLDLAARNERDGAVITDLAAAVVGFAGKPWRTLGLVDSYTSHGELTDATTQKFARTMQQTNLVVVHGAVPIRPVLEAHFPWLARIPWVCSREEVAWAGSPNLEVQMMRLGCFFNVGSTLQRAHALSRLVSIGAVRSGQGERSVMQALLESSSRTSMRLLYQPPETQFSMSGKDEAIMAMGMRWDDNARAYVLNVDDRPQANARVRQLADLTNCEGRICVETVDALVRYSGRNAERKWTTFP
jgi:hypothetical protein